MQQRTTCDEEVQEEEVVVVAEAMEEVGTSLMSRTIVTMMNTMTTKSIMIPTWLEARAAICTELMFSVCFSTLRLSIPTEGTEDDQNWLSKCELMFYNVSI